MTAARFPHPDGLKRARALREPGRCLFCEEPIEPRRLICDRAECRTAYYRAWHRDAQVLHPERYGRGYVKARRERLRAAAGFDIDPSWLNRRREGA